MKNTVLSKNGIVCKASVFERSFVKRIFADDTTESIAYNHNIAHGAHNTEFDNK